MKKVAHYSNIFLNVTENWIYNQIVNNKEYEPIVFTIKFKNGNIYRIKKLYSLMHNTNSISRMYNKFWHKLFKVYPYFYRSYKNELPDLFHAHFGNAGFDILPLVTKIKKPLITTFYGFDISMLPRIGNWQKNYELLFQKGSLFLVEGNFMAKALELLGCPKEKIRVQHLGINTEEIVFKPRIWEKGTSLKVLIAASFQEKKGIPYALAALGKVKSHIPIEITIIGDANDEERSKEEKKKILDVVKEYNLEKNLKMLGYQPYKVLMDEAYKHHIFLSPSVTACNGDNEGGAPVAIIEMAASGMLVISSKHCDIPEIIQHQKTGLLADERDVEGLVTCIHWVVDNMEKWSYIQNSARKHVENEYNAKIQGYRLGLIYDEVLYNG